MKERQAFSRDAAEIRRPRNDVERTVQRLRDALEEAADVTLSLREASNLVSFVAAAKRLEESATRVVESADAAIHRTSSLQYELQEAERAWMAAERRLHELDLAGLEAKATLNRGVAVRGIV